MQIVNNTFSAEKLNSKRLKNTNRNNTISFKALKKSAFSGIDFVAVEKFKAPIEKFDVLEDLQIWAGKLLKNVIYRNFEGRQSETTVQRNIVLNKWFDYVVNGNEAYSNVVKLIILSAIVKGLSHLNDKLPPELNKGVLADTLTDFEEIVKKNSKIQLDFGKMYQNKLRSYFLNDDFVHTGETETKWVVIPSLRNDCQNFYKNVEKLKTLSCSTWCTKSYNAEPYLRKGDFHIYLDCGQPKIGIRFVENKIEEIQGPLNNSNIPLDCLDIVEKYINEKHLNLNYSAEDEIYVLRKSKHKMNEAKNKLSQAIRNNDIKKILNYYDINTEKNSDGKLIISKFDLDGNYTLADIGVDEEKFFENIVEINGDADFSHIKMNSIKNIKTIAGTAYFMYSPLTNLGNLKFIGGTALFQYSKVKNLGNLEYIGGDAILFDSKIESLGNLYTIEGYADFSNSKIKELGNLEFVGGSIKFSDSSVIDLSNLEYIGGDADFSNSRVSRLGMLKTIEGKANISNSQLTSYDLINLNCKIIS